MSRTILLIQIITLVEQSALSVKATPKELNINCSTFYQWYKQYLQGGYDALTSQTSPKRGYWNQVPIGQRDLPLLSLYTQAGLSLPLGGDPEVGDVAGDGLGVV